MNCTKPWPSLLMTLSMLLCNSRAAEEGGDRLSRSRLNEYQCISNMIETLSVTNDADRLAVIHAEIDKFDLSETVSGKNRGFLQQESLKLWLEILNKIDEISDINFDANDVPLMNVGPPPGAVGLRSGISPKEIEDPEVRRQYEALLRDNAIKARIYRFQKRLRILDKKYSGKVLLFLKEHYAAFPESRGDIDILLMTLIRDPSRQQSLKRAVIGKNE